LYSMLLYGDELSKQLAVHIPVSCVFLKLLMFMVTTETVTHKTNSNHFHIQKIPCEYTVSTVTQYSLQIKDLLPHFA